MSNDSIDLATPGRVELSEATKARLKALWAEVMSQPEPEPEPVNPTPIPPGFKKGQRVKVSAEDPDWPHHCAGHPALGTLGTVVFEASTPIGKVCIKFTGTRGRLPLIGGDCYTDVTKANPIRLYLPIDCVEVVP